MTAAVVTSNLATESGLLNIPVKQLQRRVIQRVSYTHRVGWWRNNNTYNWIAGAYVDFRPVRGDTRIRFISNLHTRQYGGSQHMITHYKFYIDDVEYARFTRGGHHIENMNTMEYEVASWGAGALARAGWQSRAYSEGNHNAHIHHTQYWNGNSDGRDVPAQIIVEEYIPAYSDAPTFITASGALPGTILGSGLTYTQTIQASGTIFEIVDGQLPGNQTINRDTGVITGSSVGNEAKTYNFTVGISQNGLQTDAKNTRSFSWAITKDTRDYAFKFRTIFTRGYVSGGYQNSSPWRNVNRTVHYTDTTTNLGDMLDQAASYTDGSMSDYYQYVYCIQDAFQGSSNQTTSVNMSTETGRAMNSQMYTTQSGDDVGCIINATFTLAWIVGGSATIDKHNLVTEIMFSAGSGGTNVGTAGNYVCCWFGKDYGWVKHSSSGNRNHKIQFSNETWTTAGLTVGTDGWGKALPTKEGFAYVKNGGNTTTSCHRVDDTTGVSVQTNLSTPDNCGEENFEMGQNHGYCLGNYNGAQNNNTWKIDHTTHTMTRLGATAEPKGKGGMSSAACASASAQVLGGL